MTRSGIVGFSLIVFVAAIAFYLPALHSGFFWDDDVFITQNPQMHTWDGLRKIWFEPFSSPHYYPLLLSGFWILAQFFGNEPAGYHLVNILLHATNAILVCALGVRLRLRFAWIGALVFLLHPINVQSVAWITEMKNTLSTLFMLAGCMVWAGGRAGESPRLAAPRWWLVALLFAAAMLTKSTSLIMLLALVMIDLITGRNIKRRSYWITLAPLIAAGMSFALFSAAFERSMGGDGALRPTVLWEEFGLASWSLFFYLGKLFWPVSLAPVYPMPAIGVAWAVFWSACAILLFAVAFAWGRRRSWRPMAAILLYAVFLFPIPFIGIAFTRWYGPVTDHFAYVPSIVFSLAVCSLGSLCGAGPVLSRTFLSFALAVCILLGILTFRHAEQWRTQQVWEKAALNAPLSPAALNYASNLASNGREQEALSVARKFHAKSNYRYFVAGFYGSLLASLGETAEAEDVLRAALLRRPGDLQLWLALGKLLVNSGRAAQAVEPLTRALPANPANRLALASALVRAGRINQARSEVPRLPVPTWSNIEMLTDLAADFSEAGAFAEAESILSSNLRRFPLDHRSRLGLAYVLLDSGKIDEAHEQFSQITAFLPGNAAAIAGFSECLQRQGRSDKAFRFLQNAVQRYPSPDIRNAYAWFLATCPDAELRDPAEALQQLKAIGEERLAGSHHYQGTLAASLAASGKFPEAVEAAERALAIAEKSRDRNFIAATRQRLDLYRAGQAYVQPAVTTP